MAGACSAVLLGTLLVLSNQAFTLGGQDAVGQVGIVLPGDAAATSMAQEVAATGATAPAAAGATTAQMAAIEATAPAAATLPTVATVLAGAAKGLGAKQLLSDLQLQSLNTSDVEALSRSDNSNNIEYIRVKWVTDDGSKPDTLSLSPIADTDQYLICMQSCCTHNTEIKGTAHGGCFGREKQPARRRGKLHRRGVELG